MWGLWQSVVQQVRDLAQILWPAEGLISPQWTLNLDSSLTPVKLSSVVHHLLNTCECRYAVMLLQPLG